MNILALELDGQMPNHALMRIAAHHRLAGDTVEVRRAGTVQAIESHMFDRFDQIYASAIFERSLPLIRRLQQIHPGAIVGGSALPPAEFKTLESIGITTRDRYYYPSWAAYQHSIGYTQRGCRMNSQTCPFCKVPWMEGRIQSYDSIGRIWRGEPYPRNLLLLDNDFFGAPDWRSTIAQIREGKFRVSFNQGVNARLLSEESCEAVCSVNYYDSEFKTRRFYTAWDGRKDEQVLFTNLRRLVKYGMKPDHLMVYMLIGCLDGPEDREYRRQRLREFGARPYPMPFVRTPELVGFQRWVIGAYDKRIPWTDWQANHYRPEGLVDEKPSLF